MVADGRAGVDADLVRRLLAAQFPEWSRLEVVPVEVDGWDNRTYRLGRHLSVRLPTAEGYVAGVLKEAQWLPLLAARLPLPVPEPVGLGRPGEGYPHPWSVNRWLDGETLLSAPVEDTVALAVDLAGFLRALRELDAEGGPTAGAHSFFRGADLAHYDEETRRCLDLLEGQVPVDRALAVWDEALSSHWDRDGVWFHGDVAAGNLLVRQGRLSAVIDFGTCGVGDPACDLVIAWTFLDAPARQAFRAAQADLDEDTWARARGWALWKGLLVMTQQDPGAASAHGRVVDLVLEEAASG